MYNFCYYVYMTMKRLKNKITGKKVVLLINCITICSGA